MTRSDPAVLDDISQLDPDALRTLFDTGGEFRRHASGGEYTGDLHRDLRRVREAGPVHEGTVEDVLGIPNIHAGARPSFPEFSAFSYEAVNAAFRDPETFSSKMMLGTFDTFGRNILAMGGREHFHHRAAAAPTFARSVTQWWIDRWVGTITDTLLGRVMGTGRAELNLDLCALLPLLTITGSFGVPVADALRLRSRIEGMISPDDTREGRIAAAAGAAEILLPIIADRREHPQDDVLSKLIQETVLDEDGNRHRLTDDDVLGYARLLLTAGSGTTWRQLGITLWALLNHPDQLDAVRRDRSLVRLAVEEALRWEVTDPTFYRMTTRDTTLCGVDIPAGARVSLCLSAANHDPARWPDPERFDVHRKLRPHLSFAGGPHVCLGMHLARAEMAIAVNAVLDRLPDVRWDPDQPRPELLGVHMRGPGAIPVVFG